MHPVYWLNLLPIADAILPIPSRILPNGDVILLMPLCILPTGENILPIPSRISPRGERILPPAGMIWGVCIGAARRTSLLFAISPNITDREDERSSEADPNHMSISLMFTCDGRIYRSALSKLPGRRHQNIFAALPVYRLPLSGFTSTGSARIRRRDEFRSSVRNSRSVGGAPGNRAPTK